jgi:hypothetical protein
MELFLILFAIVSVSLILAYTVHKYNKTSKEKRIFFEVVNDLHASHSTDDIEQKLIKKYNFHKYEAGLIVSSIVEGESAYAMDYMKELFKRYEEAN